MNTEIARTSESLEIQVRRAQLMAEAGAVLPATYRGNPAALMVAFEYADALGIPRINALTSIHIVDGKPTASADLIGALVRRAGHKLRVSGDETYAEALIIRGDDPEFIPEPIRWDEARARKAGLWGKKGPWQNYPGAMMRSRAVTEAARMWASDALYGVIYTAEEIGDQEPIPVRNETPHTQQAPSTLADKLEDTAPRPEYDYDEIENGVAESTDIDGLRLLWKEMNGVGGERAGQVCSLIMARVNALKAEAEPEPAPEPSHDEAEQTLADVLDAEVVVS